MTVAAVVKKLGGKKVLKVNVTTEMDLALMVRSGLPSGALDYVIKDAMPWIPSVGTILTVLGSPRTLERKRSGKATHLKPAESDRLTRFARMLVRAEEAIGNPDNAHKWLTTPNRELEGEEPLSLLDSDAGTLAVERLLGRIEHGIFS